MTDFDWFLLGLIFWVTTTAIYWCSSQMPLDSHPRRKPWWLRMKQRWQNFWWEYRAGWLLMRCRTGCADDRQCQYSGDCDFPFCSPFVWVQWWRRLWDWDRWVGNDPVGGFDTAVLKIKHLVHLWGCRIDLHCFVAADAEGCFHSHPAAAIRLVLWGGYEEEIFDDRDERNFDLWLPGSIGIIRPEFAHRVHRLVNGRVSYSLWFRGPITHNIHILGPGYDEELSPDESKARVSHVKEN